MSQLIDGKALAAKIKEDIKTEIARLRITPGLAVVLVGTNPASQSYVRSKEKACQELGFYSEKYELAENTDEKDLISLITALNHKPEIHGILVQLPLPKHINEETVLSTIDPRKDIDGFHFYNLGRLFATKGIPGTDLFIPCTPKGIMRLIESTGVAISGKKAVVLGRSNIVGKPVALLLLQQDATVEICHSKTQNLALECAGADILVVAIGKENFIRGDMVKPGAIVIDVGINRIEDESDKGYHIGGDVRFSEVQEKAAYITPVPGGVGPMTIAMLLENTLMAAKLNPVKPLTFIQTKD